MAIGRSVNVPVTRTLPRRKQGASIPDFLRECPEIALLHQKRANSKGIRQTPSVTMTFDGGRVNACLNDRAKELTLFVTAETPMEALRLLNRKLMGDNPDWRPGRRWGS